MAKKPVLPYDIVLATDDTPADANASDMGAQVGWYLGWAIDNNLISDRLRGSCGPMIEEFRQRRLLSREVLRVCCEDALHPDHLTDVGNAFTRSYYLPRWEHFYFRDIEALFPNVENFVYLKDNWADYQMVAAQVSQRFDAWRTTRR